MGVTAHLVVVGTELLGSKQDRNGPAVARALAARGVAVRGLEIVPDEEALLARRIELALAGGGLVLTLGGLGPTTDDLTREALARATGLGIVEDAATRARLEAFYRDRGREPNALTWRQALVPEGATVIPNVTGMAAGAVVSTPSAIVAMLPGPPGELDAMLDATLDEALRQLAARGLAPEPAPWRRTLLLCGIGESDAATRMRGLDEMKGLDVAWLPHAGQVRLILAGAQERVEAAVAACVATLGAHVVSTDGRSLPEVVVATLAERGETVAAAESCTGGLVSAALTSVPGASSVVRAGIVAYANEAKTELLGVAPDILARHGAVSEETALAMAAGMRRVAGADFGLAVTGIAGPTGATPGKPVGLVHAAVLAPDGRSAARRLQLHGSRDDVRAASTWAVLDMLRRALQAG